MNTVSEVDSNGVARFIMAVCRRNFCSIRECQQVGQKYYDSAEMRCLLDMLESDSERFIVIHSYGIYGERLSAEEISRRSGISIATIDRLKRKITQQLNDYWCGHSTVYTWREDPLLRELDIDNRAVIYLVKGGVTSLDKLLNLTYYELLRIKFVGQKTADSLVAQLTERGLSLRSSD